MEMSGEVLLRRTTSKERLKRSVRDKNGHILKRKLQKGREGEEEAKKLKERHRRYGSIKKDDLLPQLVDEAKEKAEDAEIGGMAHAQANAGLHDSFYQAFTTTSHQSRASLEQNRRSSVVAVDTILPQGCASRNSMQILEKLV